MSVRDNDPEEAKSITLYTADGVEAAAAAKELEEWFEAFRGADPEQIEILPPILATGAEYNDQEANET